MDGVARLLADRLAGLWKGSPSIAARIFTSLRVPKSSAASPIATHAPRTSVFAFVKLSVELSQHDS
jgi:hypothetical protein